MSRIAQSSLVLSFLVAAGLTLGASTASAEMALSLYTGGQTAPHSTVDVSDQPDFTAGWEGKSFSAPPYYGVRGTWWLDGMGYSNLGLSLDYTHAKIYADDETLSKANWSDFEFTDGLNLLTLNALYRFPLENSRITPYVGAGVGINVPHVEVTRGSGKTFEYQVGGATLQAQAGLDFRITDHVSAFAEYKGNYSFVSADIDSGATLKTNVMTNAINVGLTYRW